MDLTTKPSTYVPAWSHFSGNAIKMLHFTAKTVLSGLNLTHKNHKKLTLLWIMTYDNCALKQTHIPTLNIKHLTFFPNAHKKCHA